MMHHGERGYTQPGSCNGRARRFSALLQGALLQRCVDIASHLSFTCFDAAASSSHSTIAITVWRLARIVPAFFLNNIAQ